jgi:hypothetical protein
MTEFTTQPPRNDFTPQEYVKIEPVNAYCNWVLGQPFKDSIAKLDTEGIVAYINEIVNSLKPLDAEAKRFWSGYSVS